MNCRGAGKKLFDFAERRIRNTRIIDAAAQCWIRFIRFLQSKLKKVLQKYTKAVVGDYQAGFRKSISVIGQIHVIRRIKENFKEKRTNAGFVDFKSKKMVISHTY